MDLSFLDRATAERLMRELWAEYLADVGPRLRAIPSQLEAPEDVRQLLARKIEAALHEIADPDVGRNIDEASRR